jgi:hypothetical protein
MKLSLNDTHFLKQKSSYFADLPTYQCSSITLPFDESMCKNTFSFNALAKLIQVLISLYMFWQSAIGEGMTRRDHSDVSNQVGIVHCKAQNLTSRNVMIV